MYGAAIGDICGSRFEADPIKQKNFKLFSKDCSITDDTVMTVAIANSLLDCGDQLEEFDLYFYLKTWGLRYYDVGYGRRFIQWLFFEEEPYNSFGNGSAMRVSAVGWLYDSIEEVREKARLTAGITHNHPEGYKGAEAVASAIFLARTGSSKEEIKKYIEDEFNYDLNRSLDDIRKDYDFDVTCQGSVPESIIAFLEAEDFEDAIRNAISLGGDADTQAAIAGSIAEAYFGIPKSLIRKAKKYIPEDMQYILDSIVMKGENYDL